MDTHALYRQGITISEIARRTGHDRKTIRSYLRGDREPGIRKRAAPDVFEPFTAYVTARLIENSHLWAVTLLDELRQPGFEGSYQSPTGYIRDRSLRPACQACAHVTQRPNAVIEHPAGEEAQFDWPELADAPEQWAYPTKREFVPVG